MPPSSPGRPSAAGLHRPSAAGLHRPPALGLPHPPALATGFVPRPETGAAASAALVPGATVVLVSDRGVAAGSQVPTTTERVATGAREWADSCGKTQLAIHLATALRDAGRVDVVIWVPATSRASVLSAYVEAATGLGLQVADGDADASAARLLSWLSEAPRPWVVVFDDLREPVTLDQLWPAGPAGRVLVTATSQAAVRSHGLANMVIIPVGPMSSRESLSYLMGRLTEDLDQRQGAADLVAELGDEPLALRHASSVIATSELTCRAYLDRLVDRREQSRAMSASPAALTWALAVEHADLLAGSIVHAQLTFASLLEGNGMPYSAFIAAGRQQGVAEPTVSRGLAALEASGLLSADRTLDPPLVRMNWVVQAAARAASPAAAIGPVASLAADVLLAEWPEDDRPEWLAQAFRSCADNLRQAAGDTLWQGAACHKLLLRAGQSLDALPAASAAVDYWSDLAVTSERLLGSDHPDSFAISDRLARAYLVAGRATDAIAWFQWVRNDRASRLGSESLETADASRDLGMALLAAGRGAEAAAMLTTAVAAYDQLAGVTSPQSMGTRDDLIAALRANGKLLEAVWVGQRVHGDRERAQGPHHPDTLSTALLLAKAYLANGDSKAAVALLKDIVAKREKLLGTRHADTIAARSALADAYHGAGKRTLSVHLYEQVSAEYSQLFGSGSRPALSASISLAHALYAVGRVTDAAKLLRESLDRCEVQLPPGDPLIATALASLRNLSGGRPSSEAPAAAEPETPPPAAGPAGKADAARRAVGRHRTSR